MLHEVCYVCFVRFNMLYWTRRSFIFWKGSFYVHLLGGGYKHVTTLSTPSKSEDYLFSFFYLLYFYIFYLNIGDNVHLKCKGVWGKL